MENSENRSVYPGAQPSYAQVIARAINTPRLAASPCQTSTSSIRSAERRLPARRTSRLAGCALARTCAAPTSPGSPMLAARMAGGRRVLSGERREVADSMYQECGAMQHCPLRRLLLAERRITPSRRVHVRDIDSTLRGCVDSVAAFNFVDGLYSAAVRGVGCPSQRWLPSAAYFGSTAALYDTVRSLLWLRHG